MSDLRSITDKIKQVAASALQAADQLVPYWLPEGRRNGGEWVALNPVRGDQKAGSFRVSLISGRWNDFADDRAHGSDLVSLLAYLRGCRQFEAAREIDQYLRLGLLRPGAGIGISSTPSPAQREAQARLEQETKWQQQQQVAFTAQQMWAQAQVADAVHPYALVKGIRPVGARQLNNGSLLIPLYQDGQLVNVQIISAEGQKRFLKGGRVKGCFTLLGEPDAQQRLFLCEGWATGVTLNQWTGIPVACAFYAGNLTRVALALRAHYGPQLDLVIAGDDDRLTKGNPGRVAAHQAATEAGAKVVFPEWPADAPLTLTDFNDLSNWIAGSAV